MQFMRDDVDPKSVAKLHLIERWTWRHSNGTAIQDCDYYGYRAVTWSGQRRVFLALQPGDLSVDWLDVTDEERAGYFIVGDRQAA